QIPDARLRSDAELETAHRLLRPGIQRTPADAAERAARVPDLQPEVLADAHVVDEAEILMDETQPGVSRGGGAEAVRTVLLAGDDDGAGVGGMHTGEDFDERRLPRAVLADQSMDASGADSDADLSQRHRPREVLRDAANRERGRCYPFPHAFLY